MKLSQINLLIVLAVLFCQTALANNITLQQAVDAAYQNNEEIKAQEFSLAASKSLKTRAMVGGFLPQVALDINQGDRKFKIGDNQTVNGDVNTRDFSVSQDLFNGGKSIFDIKRAGSIAQKEQFTLMSKKQEIALQVIKSYADILKYIDLFALGEENIKSYQSILDHTKKKINARDASKADLAKAEADYISAVNNQSNVNNNLLSARANFIKLTGFREDEIQGLSVFSEVKIDQKFTNLNQIKSEELALKNNPDLKAAEQNHRAAKFESYMAKSSLSPTATFKYQVSEDKKSLFFENQRQRNDSVFVNFHIPIFSSGTEYADIGYSKNKEQQEKYNLEATRKRVIEASNTYLNEMNNFNQSYKSAIELEKANQVYFDSTSREEKFGTKSILDLLIAKQQFYQSQTSRINYYYDYVTSIFKLEALIGSLSAAN